MTEVVIASAARTPIGRFQGTLSSFTAPQLGAIAARAALERAGVAPDQVNEVIMGNVLGAGLGQAPARQVLRAAGIPDAVPAVTINKVCGSGLQAVMLAAQAIKCGDADVVLAGGMESMTNAPYIVPSARDGMRLGHAKILDSMVSDGLWDPYYDMHMGNTGEAVCTEYNLSCTIDGSKMGSTKKLKTDARIGLYLANARVSLMQFKLRGTVDTSKL